MHRMSFYTILLRITLGLLAVHAGIAVQAQSATADSLLQDFRWYRSHTLHEKIYLHTDKDLYLAGEICWFKLYDVDASGHQPMDLSKLAYVELFNPQHKPSLQAKIRLEKGSGNGSFNLPASLPSGYYVLRAYTNWMKNAGAEYFFEKRILLINTQLTAPAAVRVTATGGRVRFFPEGGSLVAGLTSRVAFLLQDGTGRGQQGTGVVYDDRGDSLVRFQAEARGMGSFLLTPQSGRHYMAAIHFPNGTVLQQALPEFSEQGYALQLVSTDSNFLDVNINVNLPQLNESVYLFVHSRGQVKMALQQTLQNGQTQFRIRKSALAAGISEITLFTADRRPVCERLVFRYPEDTLELSVKADKPVYSTREKIAVRLDMKGLNANTAADLSMAVYRVDSLQGLNATDIQSYLYLQSDLAGEIETPAAYFSQNRAQREHEVDLLMMTQGWRCFRWEDVLTRRQPGFKFLPEYDGHLVTGRLTRKNSVVPPADIPVYLSVPGTRTIFQTTLTDSSGGFLFDMGNLYTDGQIIVQTNFQQDSNYAVMVNNPFSDQLPFTGQRAFELSMVSPSLLALHHKLVQVQDSYLQKEQNRFLFPQVDTIPFYVQPDARYWLDNYTRFTTMEEVLREYVMGVNVRRRYNRPHLPVMNLVGNTFFESEPMILLDGVPVFDLQKIMDYDPLKVQRLDVITRKYYTGNQTFEGLLNFTTYTGKLEGYELDPNAVVLDYEGLQLERIFYSPDYSTAQRINSRLPDFRTLLCWNPAVQVGEKGMGTQQFFSSDIPGKYVIVVEGISSKGQAVSSTSFFEVQDQHQDERRYSPVPAF